MACSAVPEAPSPLASDGPAFPWREGLFTFAITELVRQHRETFAPLWTTESWAKLLIWLALSSGCPADPAALERFASGLPPDLSRRLRQVFFTSDLEDLQLRLLADPAEEQVLALPLDALAGTLDRAGVGTALDRVGLSPWVTPTEQWRQHEALIVVPWRGRMAACD